MTNPTQITARPGVPFVDLVREFDAPPAAVYRAHTDPELFPRWMFPRDIQVQKMQMDARTGGSGSFIHTSEFSFAPGHPTLSVTRFERLDELLAASTTPA